MAQLLKLKDAGSRWQKAIDALRKKPQEGIVRDEQDQPVAVVLPMELYESLQGQREKDFAIFAEVDEALKDYDPEELQTRIDQAVEEVKAKSRPQPAAT